MFATGTTLRFCLQFARQSREKIQTQFNKHPKVTNAVSGFVTFSFGDILAQQMVDFGAWDKKRTFQAGLLGGAMNGVCLHYWYRSLDFAFGSNMKSKFGIACKIVLDQVLYAPFAIISYFSLSIYQKSKTKDMDSMKDDLKLKVKDSFTTVFLADCCLWPFVNFLNFRVVPIVYRPTFISLAQLSWQSYLSSASHWDTSSAKITVSGGGGTLDLALPKNPLEPSQAPFPFKEQAITTSCADAGGKENNESNNGSESRVSNAGGSNFSSARSIRSDVQR